MSNGEASEFFKLVNNCHARLRDVLWKLIYVYIYTVLCEYDMPAMI